MGSMPGLRAGLTRRDRCQCQSCRCVDLKGEAPLANMSAFPWELPGSGAHRLAALHWQVSMGSFLQRRRHLFIGQPSNGKAEADQVVTVTGTTVKGGLWIFQLKLQVTLIHPYSPLQVNISQAVTLHSAAYTGVPYRYVWLCELGCCVCHLKVIGSHPKTSLSQDNCSNDWWTLLS